MKCGGQIWHQKHEKQKKKIDKLDFVKTETHVHQRALSKKWKGKQWEKIFVNHMCDKGLVSGICREHLQLNNRETNNQLKEMGRGLE